MICRKAGIEYGKGGVQQRYLVPKLAWHHVLPDISKMTSYHHSSSRPSSPIVPKVSLVALRADSHHTKFLTDMNCFVTGRRKAKALSGAPAKDPSKRWKPADLGEPCPRPWSLSHPIAGLSSFREAELPGFSYKVDRQTEF
jgi:hypothetical protein